MSDSTNPSPDAQGEEKKHMNPVAETAVIVVAALLFAFVIQWLLVKPYKIPSESMVPTLQLGQRVLVNRVEGRFGTPERGNVVVFHPPPGADNQQCGIASGENFGPPEQTYVGPPDLQDMAGSGDSSFMACPVANKGAQKQAFIKRLIGLPGDRFKLINGHAYINGKELVEPYINPADSCDQAGTVSFGCTFSKEFTIPPGMYYFLGDNRARSDDSRFWGPVPKKNIIGEAFATYWPPSRVGGL